MRKTLTLAALCVTLTGASQSWQRADFTFRSEQVRSAEDVPTHIRVAACVGQQTVQEFTIELDGAPEETSYRDLGNITESDLNGDGFDDVQVYLGYYGRGANDNYYEALLWDPAQGRFLQADGYKYLSDPQKVEKTGMLRTVEHDGPDAMQTSYYRWVGKTVEYVRCEIWEPGDGSAPDYSGLLDLPVYRFDVTLDSRIKAIIAFQENADGILAGYIYYPKARQPAPIMICGTSLHRDDEIRYSLEEYQADGKITGGIGIVCNSATGDVDEGIWNNPLNGNGLIFTEAKARRDAPKWFTQTLLSPTVPQQGSSNYGFMWWNLDEQSMWKSHFNLRVEGDKVHFDCEKMYDSYIVSAQSAADRPAVLQGSSFEYQELNECHYGLQAWIFPRFMAVKSTTDAHTRHCWRNDEIPTLEGIYIKEK